MEKDIILQDIYNELSTLPKYELEKVKNYFAKANRFQKPKMVNADSSSHSFERFGKNYKCSKCGLIGQLVFAFPLTLNVVKYRDCTQDIVMNNLSQPEGRVKILRDLPDFGLKKQDVVEIVQCPVEFAEKYGDKVWVFSPSRNKPCRLFSREYDFI